MPCRADVFASDLVAVVLVVLVVVLAAGAARRTCRGFLGQPLPLSKCAFHWLSVGGSIAVIQRGQHTSLSLRALQFDLSVCCSHCSTGIACLQRVHCLMRCRLAQSVKV